MLNIITSNITNIIKLEPEEIEIQGQYTTGNNKKRRRIFVDYHGHTNTKSKLN